MFFRDRFCRKNCASNTKYDKLRESGGGEMAVELKDLYEKIKPQYDIKLHTVSCFGKMIVWVHMVEDVNFIPLLHGDELVFNSGLNYTSEEWLREYIEFLNKARAGGLIIALLEERLLSQDIIDYCNQIKFPLFSASWNTPYIDIMRTFSVILLQNEQKETNLITALKNAIYYPQNKEHYRGQLERAGFTRDMEYVIAIVSCHAYDLGGTNEWLKKIEMHLHHNMKNSIIYEEDGCLVMLAAGYKKSRVFAELQRMCNRDKNIYVGVGQSVQGPEHICQSYAQADTAYRLTKTIIPRNLLDYSELGIYKILADVKEAMVYPEFVRETLGTLQDYDADHGTDYMNILEAYFENECSIIHTAQVLYCHKNTLAYKLNKIREILGYDILTNENRTKIMISLYILHLGQEYYEKV